MVAAGEITRDGDALGYGDGRLGSSGRAWLDMYASVLETFVEGYAIAARSLLHLLDRSMSEKELQKRCLSHGRRLFGSGEVQRSEAVNSSLINNAISALLDQGYLRRQDGKLELASAVRSQDGIDQLAARLIQYTAPAKGAIF